MLSARLTVHGASIFPTLQLNQEKESLHVFCLVNTSHCLIIALETLANLNHAATQMSVTPPFGFPHCV
jgi:hypothetical protein